MIKASENESYTESKKQKKNEAGSERTAQTIKEKEKLIER
jgi:hypothetical protein